MAPLLVLAVSCSASSTGTTAQVADDTRAPDLSAEITVAQVAPPTGFDPHKLLAPKHSGPAYIVPVYDQLLTLDDKLQAQPMLADQWQVAPDGLSMSMTLREGVTFQDGATFDAGTVVANFDRAKSLPGSTAAPLLAKVSAVQAVAPDSVSFVFTEPYYNFAYLLAANVNVSSMVSPRAIEEGRNLDREPAGSGPFQLVEFGQDRAVYERDDNYWDKDSLPEIAKATIVGVPDDNARLAGLQTGQFQIASFRPSYAAQYNGLLASGTFTSEEFAGQVITLLLDTSKPGLGDERVRRALSMAIDRQGINDALLDGAAEPAYQFYGPDSVGHIDELDVDPYNPEEAKRLLEEAGFTDLQLNAITTSTEPADSIVTIVQSQFAEVGVTLTIDRVQNVAGRPTWLKGGHAMLMTSLNPSGDPSTFVEDTIFGSDSPGDEPPALTEAAQRSLLISPDTPERPAAFEQVTRELANTPRHLTLLRMPVVYIGANDVMNMNRMTFSQIGSMFDIRPLAVADTGRG